MRPEQERVKNLLTDTVTLLCKNGLTYKQDLKIEALIGITVDRDDVFIVHINERFDPHGEQYSDADLAISASVTDVAGSEKDRRQSDIDSLHRGVTDTSADSTSPKKTDCSNTERNDTGSVLAAAKRVCKENNPKPMTGEGKKEVIIKIEDEEEAVDFIGAEQLVLNSPNTVAQKATMIAGQRRVPQPQKRQYSQQNYPESDAMRHSYSGFSIPDNGTDRIWEAEPATKRQMMDDYFPFMSEQGDVSGQLMLDSNGQLVSADAGGTGRAGCSSWPTNTSSRSAIQSDMMALLGGASEARYPTLSGLQSHAHRQLLATHIIDPVLNAEGQMCAFRLSWYGKAGCNLDSAWNDIVAHQKHCDQLVTSFPGLAVVGSAFTGTVSGLKKGESGASRRTYPGLSYFVVPAGEDFVYPNLLTGMERNNLGAIMKPMLGLHEQTRAKLCSALYLVFKDNVDTGYVQRMVDLSASCHGEQLEDGGRHYPMVRFYVRGDDHWKSMVEAHSKLQEAGFKAILHRLDD